MAVRRKYVSAAVADAPIEPAMPVQTQAAPPEPPATPMPPPEAAEQSPLQRALESQVRAEELQRQNRPQQQPQSVEQYIDGLPGLTDHKRSFLKQFPGLLAPDVAPIMGRAYQDGLQLGLKDDSEDLDRHILETVTREIEHQAALTSPEARSTRENAQRNHETNVAAEELDNEAESLLEEALAAHAPPPPASPRRSIPFSAPVSREVTMSTGGRPSGTNTLSREEREIAHISFPHMAKTAAEFEYLKNRKRMQAMKADGRIQGDR